MDKIDIKSLSKEELEAALKDLGGETYRARQIFRWLYKIGVKSFDEMTDIPAGLRQKLKAKFHITHFTILDSKRSAPDGTAKYLFKLEDANTVEAVFLPEERRNTICLSSQVGCKYGCSFCASASLGFVRNLEPSEILEEVMAVRRIYPVSAITNLVFMGIGEPLDNYDNVMKAIRIFNDKDAFNIGARKMTISTCGLIPGIERLKREALQVELSVSLHSADDEVRSKLVPINKKYPLKNLIAACREYVKSTNRIITFEYTLMEGVNCSNKDAAALARLLKGLKCKVNTISCNRIRQVRNIESARMIPNPMRSRPYSGPSEKTIALFVKALKTAGVNVTHRRPKGEDIDAGCGQLRIAKL
ncbi:MAG: 23S rRNA (adenine(2503)-C(2))-methyltransferase RlmN [Candidatus Omnitrophota bacterium]|nr:23S rRNA (adenine(2503)-C(2))-methyltransferase RlmN [Candidatus Omnitrophota bacterium]